MPVVMDKGFPNLAMLIVYVYVNVSELIFWFGLN